MGNHVAILKSQSSRLVAMGTRMHESLKVAIFLFALLQRPEYSAIVATVNTM